MQPLARVTTELRASAIGSLAVGDLGLLVSAIRADHPGRAVLLFLATTVAMGIAWTVLGSGRIRKDAPRAGPPPMSHSPEEAAATVRRVVLGLVPVAVLLGLLAAVAPETGAVLSGIPAGVGAGELSALGWVRRFEADRGDALLRSASGPAFLGARRQLYARPTAESTDAT